MDKNGKEGFGLIVIFNCGVWLEMEIDVKDIFYVWIDCICKIFLIVLVCVLGFGLDDIIFEIFGDSESLCNIIEKDLYKNVSDFCIEEGLKDIYECFCLGELKIVDSLCSLLIVCFFDLKCYDLVNVGCYKVNKKLDLKICLLNLILVEMLVDLEIGEIIVEKGMVLIY